MVAGRESWGALFAIFIPEPTSATSGPAGGSVEPVVRQIPVDAVGYAEADRILDRKSTAELRAMLVRSEPKTIARGGES